MMQTRQHFFPRSKLGLVLSILYLILAIGIARADRYEPPASGFISTQGLATSAVTFPGAYILSTLCPPLSFDQLSFFETPYSTHTVLAIGLAIAICAFLIYLFGALLGATAKAIFGKKSE